MCSLPWRLNIAMLATIRATDSSNGTTSKSALAMRFSWASRCQPASSSMMLSHWLEAWVFAEVTDGVHEDGNATRISANVPDFTLGIV